MVVVTRTPRWRRAAFVVPVLIGLLAFGLRVWQPGPVTVTADEPVWLMRADGFRVALQQGDFARTTPANHVPGTKNTTMPGVTTMWAANIGRGLTNIGARIGLNDQVNGPSAESATVLRAGRGVVALWSAILIGLVVALGWALFGRIAATTAGIVLATEPWFVGIGHIVHTDQLLTLFSAVSMLGLAWALQHPRGQPKTASRSATLTPPAWMVASSGAFAGLAILTKISAFALVIPGALIIVVVKSVDEIHLSGWKPVFEPRLFRRWIRLGLWWTGSALAIFIILWPAMWVAPIVQVRDMFHSGGLAGEGHPQFFLGRSTRDPGVIYYPVAWVFRMTPWLLIGALGVGVACIIQLGRWSMRLWRRLKYSVPRRPLTDQVPLWVVLVCVPYALVISLAPKKLLRYVTPLLPYLALAIGVIVTNILRVVQRRTGIRWLGVPLGIAATITISTLTVAQAPYAMSYTNRMLGGGQVAQHEIMLGWGEGMEAMGATIASRETGRCDEINVAIGPRPTPAIPCGNPVEYEALGGDPDDVDYVVTYVNQVQRDVFALLKPTLERRTTLIDQIDIDGVTYARLWYVD